MPVDYDLITEIGGTPITEEAASMFYTRYAIAAELARGRRSLELGCASGTGLGLLLQTADFVAGGDIHFPMLRVGAQHYAGRVPFAQFSVTDIPFSAGSFGFVFFMEASYYIRDFDRALAEIDRVLDSDGVVLFVNANPERPDFIRSPHSEHYHSALEFRALLEKRGYRVETFAAFELRGQVASGASRKVVRRMLPAARRVAEALHLVPRTLKGRARIKRLLFGRLRTMPRELQPDFAPREPLVRIGTKPANDHKVIYVLGWKNSTQRTDPGQSPDSEELLYALGQ
jgi:SAM-dependent methyltransferase